MRREKMPDPLESGRLFPFKRFRLVGNNRPSAAAAAGRRPHLLGGGRLLVRGATVLCGHAASGVPLRSMALRMTKSCRALAMRMVLGAFAFAGIRSRLAARFEIRREAVRAAM